VQLPGHRIEFVIPRGVRYVVDMELKEGQGFRSSVFFLSPVFYPVAFSHEPKTGGAENDLSSRSEPQPSRDNISLNLGSAREERERD
jgi:hypothetical protein